VKIIALNAQIPQIVLFVKVDSSFKMVIVFKLLTIEHMAMVTLVIVNHAMIIVKNVHLLINVLNAIQLIFSGKVNAKNVSLVNLSLKESVLLALNHV